MFVIEYFKGELKKLCFLGLMFILFSLEITFHAKRNHLGNYILKKKNNVQNFIANHKRYCIFRNYCSDEFFHE